MIGTYNFYRDGKLVASSDNLITEDGRGVILRFLTGQRGGFGEYMAFGIGNQPAAVTDKSLDFEYVRVPVDLKQAEPGTSSVLFRGTIADQHHFTLSEVGLYLDDDIMDVENPTNLITTFDGNDEIDWQVYDGVDYGPAEEYEGGHTGRTSYRLNVGANESLTLLRPAPFGQFGNLPGGDEFAIAYEQRSGGPAELEVRFIVSDGNYRSYTFETTAGLNTNRWTKADFTEVGTADWDEFLSMEIVVTAPAEGADILFEGMRYDNVTNNERPIMVSRSVLDTPVEKRGTSELQVEYVLNVDFAPVE